MALVSRGKAWVSLVVLLTLIWAGAVAPAPSASAASATPFSDVAAGHWAEKHIAKLALQGLVKGDKGLYSPNGNLTREQAVLIAIRFMGLEDEVQTNKVFALPGTIAVDAYFKPYINFAFQQKLLDVTEEAALATSEPKQAWGSAPATREWMAGLLVRAIGKQADAAASNGTATSFADNASINKNYVGAINVAVKLGILKGVDGNKFDPKGKLTRAMAATIFSRAESLVTTAFPGQATGIWLSIEPDELTMLHADGTVTTYTVSASTLYSQADSEKLLDSSALEPYAKALVISTDGKHADYAEQLDDTQQVKTVTGKLVVVNTSKHQISLLSGQDINSYRYDSELPPVVTDSGNNAVDLEDIPANTNVKLTVDAFSTATNVVAVSVDSTLVTKYGMGTISSIDLNAGTVTFKDDLTGVAETHTVASTATIQRNNASATVSALKAGDEITYQVTNGVLTSVVVTQSASTSITGYLFKIDTTDKTIQYRSAPDSTDLSLKFYADNVTVTVPGITGATLSTLYKGDAITLTLDSNDKVTNIAVSNRSYSTLNGGVIAANYTSDSGFLIVQSPDGTKNAYAVDGNTKFDYNGTAITQNVAMSYMVKGRKVNIGYLGTRLVSVSFLP